MTKEIYRAKQVWLERVMASGLTHAEKTFAFAIWTHAYGDKVEAWPDTDDIKSKGGFSSHGHFRDYRERLFASGAMTGELARHKGQWDNYTYRLNLGWDGTVAPKKPRKSNSDKTMAPEEPGPRDGTVAPKGTTVAPLGMNRGTSGDSHDTSGAINTTSNTSREDYKEDNNGEAAAAASSSLGCNYLMTKAEDETSLSLDENASSCSLSEESSPLVYAYEGSAFSWDEDAAAPAAEKGEWEDIEFEKDVSLRPAKFTEEEVRQYIEDPYVGGGWKPEVRADVLTHALALNADGYEGDLENLIKAAQVRALGW